MTNSEAARPSIVVGVDGSPEALRAVRWAAREAGRRDLPLRLLHVCHLVAVRHPRQIAPPADYHAAMVEQGRHWLDDAAAAARAEVPGCTPGTELREGVPAHLLVGESGSAELMVLGSRGLGGFTGLLVGSVSIALAAHAHCPVVVLRPPTVDSEPPETGHVVVGVDGSPLSEAAVGFAFEAAQARGVPLLAVHTWFDVEVAGAWSVLPGTIDWDALQAGEEKLLAERLEGRRAKFPDVDVRAVVVKDRPQHALLERAAGAQLIVVGSRGRGALTGLGLGSVSQSLLHHAECPVAVVRRESR